MSNIVADIEVRFGDGADSSELYKIELDKVLNVDDVGKEKTQFGPGDIINFLVQIGPKLRLAAIKPTDGMVSSSGGAVREREQVVDFAEIDDSLQLSYITSGPLNARWYGNTPTGLQQDAERKLTVSGGQIPALGKITYPVQFSAYKLHTPEIELEENESYPIKVWIYLEPV